MFGQVSPPRSFQCDPPSGRVGACSGEGPRACQAEPLPSLRLDPPAEPGGWHTQSLQNTAKKSRTTADREGTHE